VTNTFLPFKTQARTVDHLGREQIADSPTAISELWKNAYDAYASSVSLHIFDSPSICAGIFDDGLGMDRQDFTDRWMVLGTFSKIQSEIPAKQRPVSMKPRSSQGQKGIGRLSVAFLGPLLFLVSRKQGGNFITSLIDWRIFENPFLLLEDVRIPFVEVPDAKGVLSAFAQLSDDLVDNVWGRNGQAERNKRVIEAWEKYDKFERDLNAETLTSQQIVVSATELELAEGLMEPWKPWVEDGASGTALLIFHLKDELRVWISPASDDDESTTLKRDLRSTLTGFVDPYSEESSTFIYNVFAHRGDQLVTIVDSKEQFGRRQLHELEHYIDGGFDEFGSFSGRVRAFGRDLGNVTLPPAQFMATTSANKVGPFDFCIGTFEQDPVKSTHEPAIQTALREAAEQSAGLRVYRDELRVMPYGRPDVDFFGIEERRTLSAGREFWQHRRVFGRIALTRKLNPNLRDKAGREGFIDNAARRRLRLMVIDLLMRSARQYFGSSSEYREQWLPEIIAANKEAEAAESKVRSASLRDLTAHIRLYRNALVDSAAKAETVQTELLKARKEKNFEAFSRLAGAVDEVVQAKALYRPPPKPNRLPKRVEGDFREFRDEYNGFVASVEAISKAWADASSEFGSLDPIGTAQRSLSRHQKLLNDEIGRWTTEIKASLNSELLAIESRADNDRSLFYQRTSPLLKRVEEHPETLASTLSEMEALREELYTDLAQFYLSYRRGLSRLAAGIDVDLAISWSAEARSELETRVGQLTALAQLGITVEIIGHEFETLDGQVSRNLRRLPAEVKQSDAFRLAMEAHQALVTRLHFLAPLRIAGSQLKEVIKGLEIAEYIESFFSAQFKDSGVQFVATKDFLETSIVDFRYRIIPVFVNLVNNALYWVKFSTVRTIILDYKEDQLIVADSGKGVDPDDIGRLFEIFFTRRVSGRGVGLYLCRANLAASGRTIKYQGGGPSLPGANFLISTLGTADGN
jgi:signal transduction histidine kinase